jgi:small neutral amino acid transporter SnatA (MarC family)
MGKFDLAKLAAYASAILIALGAGANTLLNPWGLPPAEINTISLRLLSVAAGIGILTNAINTVKNQTPTNTITVTDQATGQSVQVKTLAAPTPTAPAAPPQGVSHG